MWKKVTLHKGKYLLQNLRYSIWEGNDYRTTLNSWYVCQILRCSLNIVSVFYKSISNKKIRSRIYTVIFFSSNTEQYKKSLLMKNTIEAKILCKSQVPRPGDILISFLNQLTKQEVSQSKFYYLFTIKFRLKSISQLLNLQKL